MELKHGAICATHTVAESNEQHSTGVKKKLILQNGKLHRHLKQDLAECKEDGSKHGVVSSPLFEAWDISWDIYAYHTVAVPPGASMAATTSMAGAAGQGWRTPPAEQAYAWTLMLKPPLGSVYPTWPSKMPSYYQNDCSSILPVLDSMQGMNHSRMPSQHQTHLIRGHRNDGGQRKDEWINVPASNTVMYKYVCWDQFEAPFKSHACKFRRRLHAE
eukprot:scaffold89537_cov22-Tisochrysis_lutea.AAC.2